MAHPKVPERIGRLDELAGNLWWSWHEDARSVFRILDYPLWRLDGHNPVKVMQMTSPEALKAASENRFFVDLYDSVLAHLDRDISGQNGRIAGRPTLPGGPVGNPSVKTVLHDFGGKRIIL